jgi:predicted MFS family arabinose efflux permease
MTRHQPATARVSAAMPLAVRRARVAVAAVFFANGAGIASWLPHIPMVQATLALRPSVLGGALLAMAAGALVAIPISGFATARLGSRTTVRASAALFFAALALPIVAPSLPALVAALALLGAGNGALDVSMNAQAVAVEARAGRPIMSSFHGMWSLGGFAGAGLATLALRAGAAPVAHVVGATVLFGALAFAATSRLLPREADPPADGRRLARPTGALLALGTMALLALVSEGAMGDWSAVYLERSLGTSAPTAALGFAAFSLAMAAGRFVGDALAARFGDARVVRTSTAAAAVAFGAALVVGDPTVAIAGLACVGFGLANLIPILFRAASTLPGVAASHGIAAVGTLGYAGFLAGPPLIGLAADATSLPCALGLVVGALGWIALAAARLGPSADRAVASYPAVGD